MVDKHNSIFHVSQLGLYQDRKSGFEFDPNTMTFEDGLDRLLQDALTKQVNLDGKIGLVVRVDPKGRWNPNNSMSREMGMHADLAKAGMGTGLAYFPLLNSGDLIPKDIISDLNTPDFSHKGWSRCGYVFLAPIDEMSSLQPPQLCLFSNPPDRLFLIKKLNKNIPSLHVGDDPCKKTKKTTSPASKPLKNEDKRKTKCNVITEPQMARILKKNKKIGEKKLSEILTPLWNKYFKEYNICSVEAQAHLFSQCRLESDGFSKPYKMGRKFAWALKSPAGDLSKWEGGYIHLYGNKNYGNFQKHLQAKHGDKFPNINTNRTILRNDTKKHHHELAVLSAIWYFTGHAVRVRGPKYKRIGGSNKRWTCLSAVQDFGQDMSAKQVSYMITSIVYTGGATWPTNLKWRSWKVNKKTGLQDKSLGPGTDRVNLRKLGWTDARINIYFKNKQRGYAPIRWKYYQDILKVLKE